jgi:cellulose synthase/poly-beta-1,6-N-acetylglucosamine synthase-like glycosyltransferase
MISVIIATYNGELVLPKTLQALCLLEIPSQGVEFIIVDNASTDNTAKILAEYVNKLPLTPLYEEKQGKSYAIGKGIAQSQGELVLFSDDDVIPDKKWLVSYQESSEKQTEHSVFMGQIRPYWLAKAPAWLIRLSDEGRACGCTSLERVEGPAQVSWAKGANFCVRKEVLDKISFRTDLWVAGGNSAGGEDTDFVKKASEAGYKLWFAPEASLQHIIKPHEMTVRGMWIRYFRIGRSIAAINPEDKFQGPLIFGYPRWIVFNVLKKFISLLLNILRYNPYTRISKLMEIAIICGQQYQAKHSN